jgi:hypothetical protein
MSRRFDFRDKETFKKDIYFSTMLEKHWWEKWLSATKNRDDILVQNPRSNGCDNTGEFIEHGPTSGADYIATLTYKGVQVEDCPVEIKWVPTSGKITLKEGDIKAYLKENAYILLIYSFAGDVDLKKPKDYDLDKHIQRIEDNLDNIAWALLSSEKLRELYQNFLADGRIKPVPYVGNKNALVLKSSEYDSWFVQELWR